MTQKERDKCLLEIRDMLSLLLERIPDRPTANGDHPDWKSSTRVPATQKQRATLEGLGLWNDDMDFTAALRAISEAFSRR